MFERRGVAVHQNLVLTEPVAARAFCRGDLAMVYCPACGFAWNRLFDPSKIDYSGRYDNRQEYSGCFEQHLGQRAQRVMAALGTPSAHIVEVGCGKGAFIERLLGMATGWTGTGVDSSYLGAPVGLGGRLRFRRQHFDGGNLAGSTPIDALVARHVIEHIPDPAQFLSDLRAAIAPGTRLFLETPDLGWILARQVPFDFFYEHCSLFTAHALRTLLERCGFQVQRVDAVFGDQYLWIEAEATGVFDPWHAERGVEDARGDAVAGLLDFAPYAAGFQDRFDAILRHWQLRLPALAARGPVVIWGAGAKGATLAEWIDPIHRFLAAAVDLNPNKQGRYLAGSGLAVIAPAQLCRLGPAAVFLPNPNYRGEIQVELARLGLEPVLLDPLLIDAPLALRPAS